MIDIQELTAKLARKYAKLSDDKSPEKQAILSEVEQLGSTARQAFDRWVILQMVLGG